MSAKLILLSTLFFTINVFSEERPANLYKINGQELLVKNAVVRSGQLQEGLLAEQTDVRFGKNMLKAVPAGTEIKISEGKGNSLYIRLMIFTENFESQKWLTGSGEIELNCSPHQTTERGFLGGRVVSFYENHQMRGRCAALSETLIETPDGGMVTVGLGAEIFLTKEGKLESATKVKSGYIYVNTQKVSIYENSFLDFDQNGGLHFFYLAPGESFYVPTSLSENTQFKQVQKEQPLPFIFYPSSGNIESGRLVFEGELTVEASVFGQSQNFQVFEGPAGFNEEGELDRFIVKETVMITLSKEEDVSFISPKGSNEREVTSVKLKKGYEFFVNKGNHLFLDYIDGKAVLNGLPIVAGGKRYFLSLK